MAEFRYTIHYHSDNKMRKPNTSARRSNEEKAGLKHYYFDTRQFTCISKINLAGDADEYVDSKPIVVAYSGKTMNMPIGLNLVNKSCLLKSLIDKTSVLLALDMASKSNMTLELDMAIQSLKIDMFSWLKNSNRL